jgi:hypothetical protein
VITIVTTVLFAVRRALHYLQAHSAAEICWNAAFAELPDSERACRHELAGRVISRTCDNAFDCRHCAQYAQFAALPAAGTVAAQTMDDLGIAYSRDPGIANSNDRFYHRGHTWVEPLEDGTLAIGLDELAEHLIGSPDALDMPELGSEIELNGTAWRMKKNGKEIQVHAPIEGRVVAIGSPRDGWYLKIRPRLDPSDPMTLRHLLRGAEIRGWLNREMERLQLQLRIPNTAPSLADGGVLIHGVMDALPEADWDTVLASTFLEG